MKYKYFIYLLLALFFSCTSSENDNYKELTAGLDMVDNNLTRGVGHIIIIPGAGCGGCIDAATSYVIDYIDDSLNVKVVFTGIGDLKLFKLSFEDNLLKNPEIFVDINNYLMSTKIASIYPRELTLRDSEIIKVIDFSPEPW
ncbi:hypothetical protein ACV07N_15520 [Roseivirga echinicomitans]